MKRPVYGAAAFGLVPRRTARTAIRKRRRKRAPRGRAPIRRRRNLRIGGFLGIEIKFYDKFLTNTALIAPTDAAGGELDPSATTSLNTVVQGNGEQQRDGRNIIMKSIQLRGTIRVAQQANQTLADLSPVCVIYIVLDQQTNGAQLNSEDVFTNPAGSGQQATNVYRNLEFSKRFSIIAKKVVRFPTPTLAYDGTNIEQSGIDVPFEIYKDLPNIKTNYSGTTENIANIVDNSIHVVGYCSDNSLAPRISYISRLRFCG